MFVIDILDIDPLNLKVTLEFKCVILPPKGKRLFVIARIEPGHTFKHATFDSTKEQVSVGAIINFPLP